MYNLPSRCNIVSDLEQAGVVSHQSRIIFYTGKGCLRLSFPTKVIWNSFPVIERWGSLWYMWVCSNTTVWTLSSVTRPYTYVTLNTIIRTHGRVTVLMRNYMYMMHWASLRPMHYTIAWTQLCRAVLVPPFLLVWSILRHESPLSFSNCRFNKNAFRSCFQN